MHAVIQHESKHVVSHAERTARGAASFEESWLEEGSAEIALEMYSRNVDMNITADLFAGYTAKSKVGTTRFTVGVNNITDQRPPLIYIGFAGDSDASTYDYMGRYFYARLSQLF